MTVLWCPRRLVPCILCGLHSTGYVPEDQIDKDVVDKFEKKYGRFTGAVLNVDAPPLKKP